MNACKLCQCRKCGNRECEANPCRAKYPCMSAVKFCKKIRPLKDKYYSAITKLFQERMLELIGGDELLDTRRFAHANANERKHNRNTLRAELREAVRK